uniref:NADH dehydrogenase subunit 4L n=2 Tax=Cerion TaxID=145431 RepID=A0A8K2ARA6_9EUPU|nr:NADH dehydrogenase subunit 4L [Cerion coloni]YP_010383224.1 NADH dehydrogenase subunit 4L [Cerion watlingense]UEQ12590.1 NADH dehydrogenase subunit 4L [Cerion coloni]UEQ12603.1 NADH dehydrogenase subunit 4L [Cerion watlingense]
MKLSLAVMLLSLLFMCSTSLIVNSSRCISSLMILEGMTLIMLVSMMYFLNMTASVQLIVLLLCVAVLEATIGLMILIKIVRISSNDMMLSKSLSSYS